MSRYIDAELIDFSRLNNDFDRARAKIIIMGQPTADVVDVVRCKDCKWWEAHIYGSTVGRCENPRNGLVSEYSDDTDYCSYGERGEE